MKTLFAISVVLLVACGGSGGAKDMADACKGSDPCGACDTGTIPFDSCENGQWQCSCVPADMSVVVADLSSVD